MKTILHFSHANGFPGGSYQPMLEPLRDRYDVRFSDRIGHNPSYPVSNNWLNLEAEMIAFFEKNYDAPVIAMGHSLGGMLSLRLAYKRPDLVKAVLILDVPALSLVESQALKLLKCFGMMDKVTPAARADGRRTCWGNQAEAVDYFRGKKLMRAFDQQCLESYVHFGTEPCQDGIRLRFDPKIEQAIYRTIPDDLVLKKPLHVPAAAIGGCGSTVLKMSQAVRMERKLNMKTVWLPGSHLFPLEYPLQTAQAVLALFDEMGV